MNKSKFIFTGLLIGLLFLTSSCTSDDATPVDFEDGNPLVDTGDSEIDDSLNGINDTELDDLENELIYLEELDIDLEDFDF